MVDEELVEVTPEYVYLTVPADWVCIYHKLLVYMADFGKVIVDDCTASCKGNGKNIISCWNLFQTALACRTLGRDKEAEFFINYIKNQLNSIYKGSDKEVFNSSVPLAITENGHLKAIASCSNETKFYVNVEDGKLYNISDVNDNSKYIIENNDLITKRG